MKTYAGEDALPLIYYYTFTIIPQEGLYFVDGYSVFLEEVGTI